MAGIRISGSIAVLLLMAALSPIFSAAQAPAGGSALLAALRRADAAEARKLVADGVDANSKDESGASALMHATLYASTAEMRLLLDKGADVNAANAHGSTALMWAAGDDAKVELLLTRGASPSAKAKRGHTALMSAASHGNVDAIRRLIARGADPRATTENGADLQSVALVRGMGGDTGLDQILSAARLTPAVPKGPRDTPLTASLRHPAIFRSFLDRKVKLEEESFFVTKAVPIVAAAAYHGPASSLELLLTRGGNVNVKDGQGITPLMMAAASPHPNAAIVKLLIERGAEVNARDRGGRTALDWALLQGDTPAVAVLRTAGAETSAAAPAPPAPVATPRSARDAVALAVTRLQPIGPTFNQRTRCISCHNQSLPAMAVALASRRDVPVDRTLASHPTTATLAMWQPFYEELLLGNAYTLGGFVPNTGYGLLAFAEEGVAASPTTDAVVLGLMAVQNRDGSWWIDDIRPPLGDDSRIYYTALAIRGLDVYGPPGRKTEIRARIRRARDLLRRTEPANTQDEVFKLLGLIWSQASSTDVAQQAARVLKLQRTDGGWAQTPAMTADAYSTGQVLYALRTAGTAVTAPAYQSGAQFLLRTQLEDGSWFVRARGFAFQPYFETGFPHGRDQFISAAATSWAAIALAYTL